MPNTFQTWQDDQAKMEAWLREQMFTRDGNKWTALGDGTEVIFGPGTEVKIRRPHQNNITIDRPTVKTFKELVG